MLGLVSCKNTSLQEKYRSKLSDLIEHNKTDLPLQNFKDATIIRNDSAIRFNEKRILQPVDIALDSSYLIIADANSNSLFQLNLHTNLIKQFGNAGRGPAEFNGIQKITGNTHHYFVLESKNSRIQILNKQYQSVHAIPLKSPCPLCSVSASGKYLMVPDLSNTNKLINVYATSPPYHQIDTLMPKLVPFGEQPFMLNAISTYQSDNGQIVVTYMGLPYYFFFDEELKQTHTIELKGTFVDNFYMSAKKRFKDVPKAEQQKNIRILTKDIALNRHYFFIALQKYVILIDLSTKKIIGTYEFMYKGSSVIPFNIAVNDTHLYLSDLIKHRLFRVRIKNDKLSGRMEVIN